ncbi:MAG: hypothetical protein AAF718_07730 [Pseudomonadota bacterium]
MIIRAGLVVALLGGATSAFATCPAPEAGRVDIYPTAPVLPENLLRVYVYFPRSMGTSAGLSHIRLLDAEGTHLDGVFLPTRESLWSQDRRRLTVLMEPGRVKTGLDASEAMGRALRSGQSYTLEVSGASLDAVGCKLGESTTVVFQVGPPDVDPPDPSKWVLRNPKAGSRDPLSVVLGSPHDHLSLAFRLRVLDAKGSIVPGQIGLSPGEDGWEFTPRAPWRAETYSLTIEDSLEDLAGNRPGALFDQPIGQTLEPWRNSLTFQPGA